MYIRRYLSILLAAALTAQMGVTAALAAGTACGPEDHGRNAHVSSVNGCGGAIHWIDAGSNTTGGSGVNYFYAGDSAQIDCGNGTANFIILEPQSITTPLTVSSFHTDTDKIYLVEAAGQEITPDPDTDTIQVDSAPVIELVGLTTSGGADGNIADVKAQGIAAPSGFTLANPGSFTIGAPTAGGKTLTAGAAPDAVGSVRYLWESSADGVLWALLEGASGNSYTVSDTTKRYRCVAVDELGRSAVSGGVSVSACNYTASLKDITISGLATGAGQVNAPETDRSYTLPADLLSFTGSDCTVASHANHGYTVAWSVAGTDNKAVSGVAVAGGSLKLTAASLPEAETAVVLTASLKKDGTATGATKTLVFRVKRAACSVTASLGGISISGLATGEGQVNAPESDKSYALPADADLLSFTGDDCGMTAHTNHGYTVAWSVAGMDNNAVSGVAIDGGSLKLTAAALPQAETEVVLTASLMKDGAGAGQTKTLVYRVRRAACRVTASLKEITGIAASYCLKADTGVTTVNLPELLNLETGEGCDLAQAHRDGSHGYSVAWSVAGANGVAIDGGLKLTAASLPETEAQATLTAVLQKDGQPVSPEQKKTFAFRVQKDMGYVCGANASGISITAPSGTIKGQQATLECAASIPSSGCTVPSHQNDPYHGYTLTWTFAPRDGSAISGVSFADGKFTIDKDQLPIVAAQGTLSVVAQKLGDPQGSVPQVSILLTFQRDGGTAATPPDTVELKPASPGGSAAAVIDNVTVGKSFTPFTASFLQNGSALSYTGPQEWSIDEAARKWASIDAKGVVTITAKPPKPSNTIQVTLRVGGGTTRSVTASATATYTVNRAAECHVTASEIKIQGNTSVAFSGSSAQTQNYTAQVKYGDTGTCEMGDAHKNGHKKVTWSITNTGSLPGGAFTLKPSDGFSTACTLTINAGKLTQGKEYTVKLQAAVDGTTTKAEFPVKVRRRAESSDKDDDDDEKAQWSAFQREIRDARSGDTLSIDLAGNTMLPFYILDAVRGKNITLEMEVLGNYTWSVNGKTVQKLPANLISVPLDVEKYRSSRMSKLCRDLDVASFRLRNLGSYYADMKLLVELPDEYAKKTLCLYSYDEDANKLTYRSSAKADSDGTVAFTFTQSKGIYVITSKALYGESTVASGGGAVGGTPSTVYPPHTATPSAPAASQGSAAASAPSSSSSSSSESSSSSSSEVPPPESSSSQEEPARPAEAEPQEEEKKPFPLLVPILIVAIAGVITATVLVVRSGSGKAEDTDPYDD